MKIEEMSNRQSEFDIRHIAFIQAFIDLNEIVKGCTDKIITGDFTECDVTLKLTISVQESEATIDGACIEYKQPVIIHKVTGAMKKQSTANGMYCNNRIAIFKNDSGEIVTAEVKDAQLAMDDYND